MPATPEGKIMKAPLHPEGAVKRLDPQALIEKALENNQGVEVLERLVGLAERVKAFEAKEAWNEAMAAFQERCGPILKNETGRIELRGGGSYSYTYASLDHILKHVQPLMAPLGLSVAWKMQTTPKDVTAICLVKHVLGHVEESGPVTIPVPEGGLGASGPQRVGIAHTYSRRYSLISILGISPEDDPDAKDDEPEEEKEMPRRASQVQAEGGPDQDGLFEKPPQSVYAGKVVSVTVKKGVNADTKKPWELFTIKCEGGEEFKTFDKADAEFAKQAAEAPVSILWEPDPKGGKKALSVEPA